MTRRHALTGGFEYRANVRQDQGVRYPFGVAGSFDALHNSTAWSVYVEDEVTVRPNVLLNVGIRHDDHDPFLDANSPRLALIYKPRSAEAFKVLYGEAFRAPNAYELYYYTEGAPARLSAERIRSLEGVWERYLARRARLTASVFLYRTRDLITETWADTSQGLAFENSGRTRAAGFGLEAESALPAGMHLTANYSFANARETSTDARLSNAPANLWHVLLAVPLGRTGLLAGIEQQFIGARRTRENGQVPSAAPWNLTVSRRRAFHGFGIAVDVKNMFDARYGDPAFAEHPSTVIPQNGRTVRARLTWQF